MSEKLRVSDYLVYVYQNDKTFAYNRLLGNFQELDSNAILVIKAIKDDDISLGNKAFLNQTDTLQNLLDWQFVVIGDFDERKAILDGMDNYLKDVKKGKRIRKLLLEVTENCNLACKYCYVPHSRSLSGNKMTFEIAKNAVDKFLSLVIGQATQDEVHIRFFGGEPLMEIKMIKELCGYIEQLEKGNLSIQYYINTNALLLTEDTISFLKANQFKIGVSMDGPKEIHDKYRVFKNNKGSYDLVVKKIQLLVDEGFPVEDIELYVTLNDTSIDCLRQTILECKKLNLVNLEVEILHDFDGKYNVSYERKISAICDAITYGEENGIKVSGKWLKLYNRLKKASLNYCGRQAEQISINPKGEVFVCSGLKVKFAELDELDKLFDNQEYINLTSRISGSIKPCNKCEIEGMCSGGCTGISDALFKNACSCEINECEFRKNLVQALIAQEVNFDFVESESYQPTTKKYLLDYSDCYKKYKEKYLT